MSKQLLYWMKTIALISVDILYVVIECSPQNHIKAQLWTAIYRKPSDSKDEKWISLISSLGAVIDWDLKLTIEQWTMTTFFEM